MKSFSKSTLLVLVGALSAILLVSGLAVANDANIAKKKKKKAAVLTSKQKKSINKMIDSKIKKIQIPTVPAGPAGYATSNTDQVNLASDLDAVTPVLSKAIPAGKYAVTARVNGFYLTDAVADEANMICRAKLNGTTVQTAQASNDAGIFLFVATGATLNTTFNFAVDAAAASNLTVDCSAGYDNPGVLQGVYVPAGNASLTAVTLSSIG